MTLAHIPPPLPSTILRTRNPTHPTIDRASRARRIAEGCEGLIRKVQVLAGGMEVMEGWVFPYRWCSIILL